MEPLIRNITATARWVAIFRAEESERPDAIFHDPLPAFLLVKEVNKLPMPWSSAGKTAGPLLPAHICLMNS